MPTIRQRTGPFCGRPSNRAVSTILYKAILLELLLDGSCLGLQATSFLPCHRYVPKKGCTSTTLYFSRPCAQRLPSWEPTSLSLGMQTANGESDPGPPPFPRPIPRSPFRDGSVAAVALGANSPSAVTVGGLATTAANDLGLGESTRRMAAGYETEEAIAQRKRAMEWLNGQRSFDTYPPPSSTQPSYQTNTPLDGSYSAYGTPPSSPTKPSSQSHTPLPQHQVWKTREQAAEAPGGLMDALESDQDLVTFGDDAHKLLSGSEFKSLIDSETKSRNWDKAEQLWQEYARAFPSSSTYLEHAGWCENDLRRVDLARSVYESMVPHLSSHDVRQPWVLVSWAAFEDRCGQSERARIIRTELARAICEQDFQLDSILPRPVSATETETEMDSTSPPPQDEVALEASAPELTETEKASGASRGVGLCFADQESSSMDKEESVQESGFSAEKTSSAKDSNPRFASSADKIDSTPMASTKEHRKSFHQSRPSETHGRKDAGIGTSRNPLTIAIGAAALLSAISFGTLFDVFRPTMPSNPTSVGNSGHGTSKSILIRDPMDEDLEISVQKTTDSREASVNGRLVNEDAPMADKVAIHGESTLSSSTLSDPKPSPIRQQSPENHISPVDKKKADSSASEDSDIFDFWLRPAKPASNPAEGSGDGAESPQVGPFNLQDISTPVLPRGEIRSLDLTKIQGITVGRVDPPRDPEGLSLASSMAPEMTEDQEATAREEQLRLKVAEFQRRELDLRRKIDEQKEIEALERVKLDELRRKEEEIREKAEERRLVEEARQRKLEDDRQRKLQEESLIAAQQERIEQLRQQEESIRAKVQQQQRLEEELQERLEASLRSAEENARREELRLAEEKLKIAEQLQRRLEDERRLNEENANKKVELQAATERLRKAEDLQKELEAEIQAAEDRARQEEIKAAEDKVRKEAELRLKEQELAKKLEEQQKLEVERQRKEDEIRVASEAKAQKEEELRFAVEKAKKEVELRRLREVELQNQLEAQQREEAREKQLEEVRKAEETRRAEEARKAAEAQKAEDARKAEEARTALEKSKRDEEARFAVDKTKKDQEARLAFERARQEEESWEAAAAAAAAVSKKTPPSFQVPSQATGISNEAVNTLGIGLIAGLGVAAATGSKGSEESRESNRSAAADLPPKPRDDVEETGDRLWPKQITRSPPEKQTRKRSGSNEGDALLQLVLFETRCGRFDRAEEAFKKYVKAFPSVSAYLRFADWAENDKTDVQLARSVYESMLTELDSAVDQSVFKQWAEFEERQGEYERAQIIYKGTLDVKDAEQPRSRGFSSSPKEGQSFGQQASPFNSYSAGISSGGQNIVNDVLSSQSFGTESSFQGRGYEPFSNKIPSAGVGGSFSPPNAIIGTKQAFPQQNPSSGGYSGNGPSFNDSRNYQQMTGPENMQSGATANYQNTPPPGNYQNAPPPGNYQNSPPPGNYQNAPPPGNYQNSLPPGNYAQGSAATYGPDLGNPAPTGLYDSSPVSRATSPVPVNQSPYQQPPPPQRPTPPTPPIEAQTSPPAKAQVSYQQTQAPETSQAPPATTSSPPPATASSSRGSKSTSRTPAATTTLETRMEQLNSEILSKNEVNESEDAVSLAQQALNLAEEAMQMTDGASPELTEEMSKAYDALTEMLADDVPPRANGVAKRNGAVKP